MEWPPFPWRLARAMLSAYYTANQRPAESIIVSLLAKIASSLPSYHLPLAYPGHTRHYMPGIKMEIIDAFIRVRDPLYVTYPDVNLDAAELELLADTILPNLRYLGRAESLCAVDAVDTPPEPNCVPLGSEVAGDVDIVDMLAPMPGCELLDVSPQSLSVRPADLHRTKRIYPPAGRWVQYALNVQERRPKTARRRRSVSVARFALLGSPLPGILQAPVVGLAARSAVLSRLREPSETLSGHRADGGPARGNNHAMFLPTAEANPARTDHITVVARSGFGNAELKALLGIGNLYAHRMPRVRAVFESVGEPGDFPGVGMLGRSRIWSTVTPVALARHTKHRGGGRTVDGPESQIISEVKQRYGHDVRRVELLETVGRYMPGEFSRPRMHGSRGGQTIGVRIEFEGEVTGPLALGFASHYGMGLFAPEGTHDG